MVIGSVLVVSWKKFHMKRAIKINVGYEKITADFFVADCQLADILPDCDLFFAI